MMRGRSTCWRRFNSSSRAEYPPGVMGNMSMLILFRVSLDDPISAWARLAAAPKRMIQNHNFAETPRRTRGGTAKGQAYPSQSVTDTFAEAPASGAVLLERPSRALDKIILQGANFQIAGEIRPDSLRRGDRAGKSCIIRHLMQEGGAAQRPRIRESLGALGRIQYKLYVAVLDEIDDMRTPLGNLIHALRLDALAIEVARGAAGRGDFEPQPRQ